MAWYDMQLVFHVMIQGLIQAGADPTIENDYKETPLGYMEKDLPTHPITVAVLEQSLDAKKTSSLVKARRLVMAAAKAIPASYLEGRVVCGLPLPRVALAPLRDGQADGEDKDEEEGSKLRTTMAFVCGWGGRACRGTFFEWCWTCSGLRGTHYGERPGGGEEGNHCRNRLRRQQ